MTVPRHLAIIMDGNGRWAEQRNRDRSLGHEAGIAPVRMCVEECIRRGVGALTLFAFSSENWQRPQDEVTALMSLFISSLEMELPKLHENGVKLRFIGERDRLDDDLRARIGAAEQHTAANRRLELQVALSYGGRWDIARAARRLAEDVSAGRIRSTEIDESALATRLSLAGLPDPDLFIRTGGEHRISNFLLWNLAYSELWFTDTLWPDFSVADIDQAFANFTARQRRFGMTGAQLRGATSA
ncbi:MAG: polyprenyl diphosphate synthase [Steroidobacteraceae bacterium]